MHCRIYNFQSSFRKIFLLENLHRQRLSLSGISSCHFSISTSFNVQRFVVLSSGSFDYYLRATYIGAFITVVLLTVSMNFAYRKLSSFFPSGGSSKVMVRVIPSTIPRSILAGAVCKRGIGILHSSKKHPMNQQLDILQLSNLHLQNVQFTKIILSMVQSVYSCS